jgi:hypothetical protein
MLLYNGGVAQVSDPSYFSKDKASRILGKISFPLSIRVTIHRIICSKEIHCNSFINAVSSVTLKVK